MEWRLTFLVLLSSFVNCIVPEEASAIIVGDELDGPNVCKRIDTYSVDVIVSEMVPYKEIKNVWCAAIPPRCKKVELKLKQVNKTETLQKTRAIRECCVGYDVNAQHNGCVPHCSKPCAHGFCSAPEQCKCESGYGGPACDISKFVLIIIGHVAIFKYILLFFYSMSTWLLGQTMQEQVRLQE